MSIFASSNGLGHIARSVQIANHLSKKFEIDLISSKKKIKKFNLNKKIKTTNLNIENPQKNNRDFSKLKKLNFEKYDINYSDNILDQHILKKKNFFYANFFWHQILNLNEEKYQYLENHLILNKIPIFGNYIFQNVNKKFNIIKVGFISKFAGKFKFNKNILISLGTADINESKRKILIKKITNILNDPNLDEYNFYIDKNYEKYIKSKKKNYKIFDYRKKMFDKISLAIIKPGLGIINDLFRFGIPVATINLNFNEEFIFNSKIMKKKKLILFETKFDNLSKELTKNYSSKKLIKLFKIYKNLKWHGENDILNFLIKHV